MSLYIRDNTVDELARRVQKITKAPNKTEAVRQALQNELTRTQAAIPLRDKIKDIQDRIAQQLGLNPKPFDMKQFTDEMWDTLALKSTIYRFYSKAMISSTPILRQFDATN